MYIRTYTVSTFIPFHSTCCLFMTIIDTTIRFENGNYRTNESVGDFTEVRLVTDQPFAKDTRVNISFEDGSATGQCNININTMSLGAMLLPTP